MFSNTKQYLLRGKNIGTLGIELGIEGQDAPSLHNWNCTNTKVFLTTK